jgi:hypothetical protein
MVKRNIVDVSDGLKSNFTTKDNRLAKISKPRLNMIVNTANNDHPCAHGFLFQIPSAKKMNNTPMLIIILPIIKAAIIEKADIIPNDNQAMASL